MKPPDRIALVRSPSPALHRGARTFVDRESIDLAVARAQHEAYVERLRSFGIAVAFLPPLPSHPDAVFVEDAAIVLDRSALITRSNEAARRGEGASVAAALEGKRTIEELAAPATLDGGDVLRIGSRLYVGRTARTNEAGRHALRRLAAREGLTVEAVDVTGCLHLKTACTCVGSDTLLFNPEWVDALAFSVARRIEVDPDEPFGANTLSVAQGHTLVSASAPRTADRLREADHTVHACDISELEKAEAGLTCLSLML